MSEERPVWQARTAMPATAAGPIEECDVLIVGGGITGLVAGIELTAAGGSVMICDASSPGEGASGRAFGSIALGSSASLTELCSRYGHVKGEALWREASASAAAFESYVHAMRVDCDYRRTGHLRLAVTSAQEAGLIADHKRWARVLGGEGLHLLSATQLGTELPSVAFRMALMDEATATIDPYRYVASLLARFQQQGGCYVASCPVEDIVRTGGSFQVKHGSGVTVAREVLLATNGHTGKLVPWLRRRVVPVGSYMIATEPLPHHLLALFHPMRRVCTTAFIMKNYFRIDTEGRLIYGGRSSLVTDKPAVAISAELEKSMLAYFPMLAGTRIEFVWGGRLGFTFDGIPHFGISKGLHYALGYCGRGLPMATLYGRAIAARVLGRQELAPEHAATDFPRRWYYRGNPWFLSMAAGWYRMKDRRG